MSRHMAPGDARDSEMIRLERAAHRRALTPAEDARLAELAFRTHHRGYRRRFDRRARA